MVLSSYCHRQPNSELKLFHAQLPESSHVTIFWPQSEQANKMLLFLTLPHLFRILGLWLCSDQTLPACLVLQVITPDGLICLGSHFRTMPPWTRTCSTNAVSVYNASAPDEG